MRQSRCEAMFVYWCDTLNCQFATPVCRHLESKECVYVCGGGVGVCVCVCVCVVCVFL
jgi:hypothetical protein